MVEVVSASTVGATSCSAGTLSRGRGWVPWERCDDWTQPAVMRMTSSRGSSGEDSSLADGFKAVSLDFGLTGFLLRNARPIERRSASARKIGGWGTDSDLVGGQRTV